MPEPPRRGEDRDPVLGVLNALEAHFDGAIARDDEIAASDLALSLAQDADLHRRVAFAGAPEVKVDGASFPVSEVGRDYLRAGPLVVPLAQSVVVFGTGARPRRTERSLLALLRASARLHAPADVATTAGSFSGILCGASEDHLVLGCRSGEIAVALGATRWIRLFRGGSVDGS